MIYNKIAEGKLAEVLDPTLPDVTLLMGSDIGEGADLEGADMPEPSAYLSAKQKDGHPLGADELYRETWAWLYEQGCSHLVSPRLIEAYAQNFARYIQCENTISHFALLGKHPLRAKL